MARIPDAPTHKLILAIQDCVKELKNEFEVTGVPIDDDNTTLHNFCDKLEYLLQDQLKDRHGLLSSRKNYWDYFCKCLASKREIHDGLIFVKSVSEFKTLLGRGRAFVRYCLVHQCLADTLQQCFQNGRVTSDFYNKDTLLLQYEQSSKLISALYDLNEILFDLASHGHDLDVSWPTFARKVFGAPSLWKAPTRAVSLTSLFSTVSQQNELLNTSFSDNSETEGRTWSQLSNIESSVVDILTKVDKLKMDQRETKEVASKTEERADEVQSSSEECNRQLIEQGAQSEAWWQEQEEHLKRKLMEMEQLAGEYARKLETVAGQQEGRESSFQKRESQLEEKVKKLESVNYDLTSQIDSLKNQLSVKGSVEEQLLATQVELKSEIERLTATAHSECTSAEVQTEAEELNVATESDDQKGPKSDLLADKELLQVEVKTLREENSKLNLQTDKWRKCIAIFSEKLAIKERVNEHLEKQVAALKEAMTSLKEVVLIKGLETTSLRNLVQELKAARGQSDNSTADAEKVKVLQLENASLTDKVSSLNANVENLKHDLEVNSRLLKEKENALACVEENTATLTNASQENDNLVSQLRKRLDDTLLENDTLHRRLGIMREMLKRVEKAEEELEKLEAAEGSSTGTLHPDKNFKGKKDDSDPTDDGDGGAAFGCKTTTINFVLCDEVSLLPDDLPVFEVVKRTVGRLHTLISDKQELLSQLKSSNEINSNLISKVQEQEEKLSTVTFELSETKALVEQLKNAHSKLQTSEAILRYELKEKRGTVERMKQMLEASRAQWMRIRQKHTESELEWQSLRADFASRVKQESVESGFVEDSNTEKSDERESSVADDIEKHPQSPSSFPSDTPPFPVADLDLEGSVSSPPLNSELEDLPESQGDDDEDSASLDMGQSRTRSRLQVMEEQCRRLYSRLVASVKKSEFLEWKLSQLHRQHGTSDEDDGNPRRENEKCLKDMNANFDIMFIPYPAKLKSPSLIPGDDMSESQESITDGDPQQDVLNTEGEMSESLSCDTENSAADDILTDQIAIHAEETFTCNNAEVADEDNEEEDVSEKCENEIKPLPLAMAQALPKRIEMLRRKKEDLEESMKRMTEEKSISDAREADLLTQLEDLKSVIEKKEACVCNLEMEKADLLQREVEFKKRVDFVMRKEREEREARYQTVMKAKQEVSSKLEMLQAQLDDKSGQILNLETALLQSTDDLDACRTTLEQEVASLRFQLSSEVLKHEKAVNNYAELETHIANMQDRIFEQEQLISSLEDQLEEIKLQRDEEKEQRRIELDELKMCLATREEECAALNEDLKATTRQYDSEKNISQQLKLAYDETKTENSKYRDELGELHGDLLELKKKLIKVIREKDLLWKRSERLSFIQKIQASDRWLKDDEVTSCLGCKAEFTMLLRKHHCRMCGRIFCSSCCNHWAMTTSSSRRVRVCNECILNHSHIDVDSMNLDSDDEDEHFSHTTSVVRTESHSLQDDAQSAMPSLNVLHCDEASSSPMNIPALNETVVNEDRSGDNSNLQQSPSPNNLLQVDEKLNRERSSLLGRLFSSWSSSPKFRSIPDDEEFYVISDEEIMRSLSHSSPYAPADGDSSDPSFHVCQTRTVDEILVEFANGIPREVWVNAGKGYGVPVAIHKKITIMWEFTSEPKSIAFSLLFHTSTNAGTSEVEENNFLQPTQILVPITHCDSHLHAIHGKLVAKKPGIYTFYFDNGFSRFMAKKVKFILRVCEGESKEN